MCFQYNRESNFDVFIGKTIVAIDAESINVVRFTFSDGTTATIDCDEQHYGIGVIQVRD